MTAKQVHFTFAASIHEVVALHAAVVQTLRFGPGQATTEGSRVRTLLLELQAGLLEQRWWRPSPDKSLQVLLELSVTQLWALQAAVRFSRRCVRGSSPDQLLLAQVLSSLSTRLAHVCPTQQLPALRASPCPKEPRS